VFALDDEQKAIVIDPDAASVDEISEASQNCPVDAIIVTDEHGAQLRFAASSGGQSVVDFPELLEDVAVMLVNLLEAACGVVDAAKGREQPGFARPEERP